MTLEQMNSRYFSLRQQLAGAYSTRPWQVDRIDSLADALAAIERKIAAQEALQRYELGAAGR